MLSPWYRKTWSERCDIYECYSFAGLAVPERSGSLNRIRVVRGYSIYGRSIKKTAYWDIEVDFTTVEAGQSLHSFIPEVRILVQRP